MNWLFRAALWLVPRSWRDSVQADLEDEARHGARRVITADVWSAWQALRLAVRLRLVLNGDALMSDIRYALRSLLRARWFTAGAALTFALGIGVNVAVFSAVDRMLFRKLPYAASSELVQLHICSETGQCYGAFPAAVVADGRDQLKTIGPMAVAGFSRAFQVEPLGSDEQPVRLHAVTANLLRVLGVTPVLGRDISDEDERAKTNVALLSYETWQTRFGGAPYVLGRRFQIQTVPPLSVTVVGVLPRGFIPPTEVMLDPEWDGLYLGEEWTAARGRTGNVLAPIARLRQGMSLDAARTEVGALVASLAPELTSPRSPTLPRIQVDRLESSLYEGVLKYAWLIVGASALILAMACANLTMLVLVRGQSRYRQTAVRIALGASRKRVLLASVLETLAVAIVGSGVALASFAALSRGIRAVLPPLFGRYMADVGDARVLGLAIGAAVVCALAAGLWPGLNALKGNISDGLSGSEARQSVRVRGGRPILVLESALGVLLIVAAVLFVGSFAKLTSNAIGFQPENLFRVRGVIPPTKAADVPGYEVALALVANLPGVIGVGGSDSIVGGGATAMRGFSKDPNLRGGRYEVNSAYFRTLGTNLLAGREFTDEEVRQRAPVAMLSAGGAALAFPNARPEAIVGRALALKDEPTRTVVGITPDLFQRFGAKPQPALYVPIGTASRRFRDFLVRAQPNALSALALKEQLNQAFQIKGALVTPLSEIMEPELRDPRFRAVLLGMLGIAGLLLAAGGLYALTAFEVVLRRREMGVRIALGASARQIHAQIIRDSAMPVVLGAAIGLVCAWWTSTLFGSLLYGVEPRALWAYALVAVTLLLTAVLAAWLPARRAARTDPAVVLRSQ